MNRPLYLNLLPVRAGGGLQNALSFLESLPDTGHPLGNVTAVVRAESALHKAANSIGLHTLAVPDSQAGRLRFELGCRSVVPKGSLVLTQFGPPWLGSYGHVINVVGNAYSNLFYPEIHFWSYRSRRDRIKSELIDLYRWASGVMADFMIFETEALRERAIRLAGFPEQRVATVPMAPSALVGADKVQPDVAEQFRTKVGEGFHILFLCGPNPNKRLHTLPVIAEKLAADGADSVRFVTTLDETSGTFRSLSTNFAQRGLERSHVNLGPVEQSDVASLISVVDAMATISRLESFSNNFVEAWAMEKPLIVTDADWARSSCGEGALYVDPEDSQRSAEQFSQLASEKKLRQELVKRGRAQLATFPMPVEKASLYLRAAERAAELGKMSYAERRAITRPLQGSILQQILR